MGISSPANGSVFNGPPPDIKGTAGNNYLEDDARVWVFVYPVPRSGIPSIYPTAQYSKALTFAGLLAASFDSYDWAWSDAAKSSADCGPIVCFVTKTALPSTDGQYRVVAEQDSDPVGGSLHTNQSPPVNFTIDTTAPDTSVDNGPNAATQATSAHFVFSGTDPDPPNGFASGIDYFSCRLDSSNVNAWEDCTPPGGSAPYTYDLSNVGEGGHTLEIKALDKASNEDPTPFTYSWGVDLTPPDITITKPQNKDRYLLHNGPNPQFNCTDPAKGDPPATPFASGIASCTATPIDDENLGPHFFEVTAVDNAGNVAKKKVAYTIDPPDYGNFIKQDNPLAYYRLGEPVGSSTMLDSSGNGHDGTYQNGIALGRDGATNCERRPHPPRVCELANPAENKAAYFGPRDDHGYVNGITAPTTAYTLEAWVKPRDGADMMVAGHGGGGQLFISGGHLAFRQTQDTIYSSGAAAEVPPGQWTHVAATWDGHTSRLYVNGKLVASSTSANKPPSGTSTFYVGYGEMAPWFHGTLDEVAYYDHAVSSHRIFDRWKIGTAYEHPSLVAGNSPYNTEGPSTDPVAPKNKGIYAPAKVPVANFDCDDPDGPADIASCTAKVDGNPINSGDPLPNGLGTHSFVVTAVDAGGNTYVHTHTYEVLTFADLYRKDSPVAYYRLGESSGPGTQPMNDSSGNGYNGEYKNGTQSGPVGIAGDGDTARQFTGADGYGYANNIPAPRFQSSLVAWVNADSTADASIVGHGDDGELFIRGGTFQYRRMGEIVDSHVAVNPGHWQQVVGTWDGVDIKIYIDGQLANSTESTIRPSSVSTFYVGYGELEPWFKGTIDEVALYPIGLSPARVYQLWLADPPADLTKSTGPSATCRFMQASVAKFRNDLIAANAALSAARKSGSAKRIARAKAAVATAKQKLIAAALNQKKYC